MISRYSRKQFLSLLGAGTCLPRALSAKDAPADATPPPAKSGHKARISFRYFLPWAPAWGDRQFADRRLDELVRFGHEAGLDAIQFFVNTFRSSYYALPVDVESQQPWIDWMREVVAPRIRAEGFGFELNFQEVLGASCGGTDLRSMYKWKQFMVDHNGHTSHGSPCPEDPVFREEMAKMLRGWSSTRPDILWIDDDFRLHNHSTNGMYCYCPLHLAKFAAVAGKAYTREKILAAVLQPGPPSGFRARWLDFLGGCMAEFAQWISTQIHAESPGTRVALMISGSNIHSLEGRDWSKVLGNFAGRSKPLVRPTFGLYCGTYSPPKAASAGLIGIITQLQVIEQALGPGGCDFAPELENTRYTTWSKSVAHSAHSLIMGQLMGLPMITIAVNDLDGSPLSEEPTLLPMFRDARSRMEALAALGLKAWPLHGLVFLGDKDIARKTHLEAGATYNEMAPGARMDSVLAEMGVPVNFMTAANAAQGAGVVMLEAGAVWLASDGELAKILSGAVFMTSGAARLVAARGFGDQIGVAVNRPRKEIVQSEEYLDDCLPGVTRIRVPHRGADWDEMEARDPRVKIASYFCDMLGVKHPGTALFINARGGRIAVYAQNSDMQGGLFGSHARLRWLHGVLAWLSDGQFAALPQIPQHGISVLKGGPDRWLYAFCNLGADPLTAFSLRWRKAAAIRSVTVLQKDGRWQPAAFSSEPGPSACGQQIAIATQLNCYDWLVTQIETGET